MIPSLERSPSSTAFSSTRRHRAGLVVAEREVVVRLLVGLVLLGPVDHVLHALDARRRPTRCPRRRSTSSSARYSASGEAPSSSIHAGDWPIQRGAKPSLAAVPQIVPASVGVATRNTASHLERWSRWTWPVTSLSPALKRCVSTTSKPSSVGREVDARLAGLAVRVVLDERADVLALAVGLVDVVVERVDRLDLVRPADRQQVLLAHPERVERAGRGEHVVALELRQHRERRRRAEHLREHHDVGS